MNIDKTRTPQLRALSVILICLYYYISLFRESSLILGLDIPMIANVLLWSFFALSALQLIINFKLVYSVYEESRTRFSLLIIAVLAFTIITNQSWLLIPLILFFLYFDDSYKALAKNLFVTSSILFIAVLLLSVLFPDLGRDVVDKSYSAIASVVGTNANSLGFPNSNHPLLYFSVLAVNGAFLFTKPRQRKIYALIMLALASIFFSLTLSVTGYISVLTFLLIYGFSSKSLLRIIRVAIPVIAILTIALIPLVSTKYGHENGNIVNNSLSNRPYLWNLRVSDGAYYNFIGNADNYQSSRDGTKDGYTLDNQYLLLIARYGWLALLIFFYIYFTRIQKVSNPAIISGLLMLSVYFISEAMMFILVLCIVPVVMIGVKISSYPRQGVIT